MSTSNLFAQPLRITQQATPFKLSGKVKRLRSTRNRRIQRNLTTVGSLLDSVHNIPLRSILLGQCLDGLPFLIKLGDPELGAILVGCDAGGGKTHQLQVMADAAIRINSPHDLQISVLSLNPQEWESFQKNSTSKKYIKSIFAWYDIRAEQTIKDLTELAEARRQNRVHGPDVLFLLDDLNYVEDMSYEAQVNLHWLLEYGAQAGVWVVGTIEAGLSNSLRYWINTFRTRIIGKILSSEDAKILAMRPDSIADHLNPGKFRVWMGNKWLNYRLVPLGG